MKEWFSASGIDEYLTPPMLMLSNVEIESKSPLELIRNVYVAPLSSRTDETLFDQIVNADVPPSLLLQGNLGQRALIYTTRDLPDLLPSFAERFRLLLALHPFVEEFNAALVRPTTIQFHRARILDNESDAGIRGSVFLDRMPLSYEKALAAILGKSISSQLQKAPVESWTFSEMSLDLERDDTLFALTLHHFLFGGDLRFWQALKMFSLGMEQLGRCDRDVASALIVAGFEALFPTQGTSDVTAQFKTIGSLLVPHADFSDWFSDLYDIRSAVFHSGHTDDITRGSTAKRLPQLIRDIELAKTVFQYCALQLMDLASECDDAMDLSAQTKRIWMTRMRQRLHWNNSSLCECLRKTSWDAPIAEELRFDVGDTSASDMDILSAGFRLLSSLAKGCGVDDVGPKVRDLASSGSPALFRLFKYLIKVEDLANKCNKVKKKPSEGELKQFMKKVQSCEPGSLSRQEWTSAFELIHVGVLEVAIGKLEASGKEQVEKTCGAELLSLANDVRQVMCILHIMLLKKFISDPDQITFDAERFDVIPTWYDMISAWNIRSAQIAGQMGHASAGEEQQL